MHQFVVASAQCRVVWSCTPQKFATHDSVQICRAKEPCASAKEPYVCAKEPYLQMCTLSWSCTAQKFAIHESVQICRAKEPCVSAKEPYASTKEPYSQMCTHDSVQICRANFCIMSCFAYVCICRRVQCMTLCKSVVQKSHVYPQKSPMYAQKSHVYRCAHCHEANFCILSCFANVCICRRVQCMTLCKSARAEICNAWHCVSLHVQKFAWICMCGNVQYMTLAMSFKTLMGWLRLVGSFKL